MEYYLLNNGEKLDIYDFRDFSDPAFKHQKMFSGASFSLIPQIDGKIVGLLIVKNGQKIKGTYVGILHFLHDIQEID